MHSRVRSAILSGTIEARRAILIGDVSAAPRILESLRRSGVNCISVLPFPALQSPSALNARGFSKDIRRIRGTLQKLQA